MSESSSPAPSVFGTSLPPSSTAASSPPPDNFKVKDEEAEEEEENASENASASISIDEQRLKFVLDKSAQYSQILKNSMDNAESRMKTMQKRGRKRATVIDKRRKITVSTLATPKIQQPSLITGATLKPYQLEGLHWMASLHANGISGILADEMGLGKTLQTIAFSAHLRDVQYVAPFLVVCPLSVLHNWIDEYTKFAPGIPVCMYHGTPAERATLRRDVLRIDLLPTKKEENADSEPSAESKPGRGRRKGGRGGARKSAPKAKKADEEEELLTPEQYQRACKFPVVITTYEMIIKDRVQLAGYNWGYIVVDEGHRLKNLDCRLTREIKKYSSASRMILTGTPLHNNLAELWSLLNFVLPDIFNDVDSFQAWFNLPAMQTSLGSDRAAHIIDALHAILKPFLLRRLKSDVESNLPPKKEYVLYAPLSITQREAYDKAYLMQDKDHSTQKTAEISAEDLGPRKLRDQRRNSRPSYIVDGDDDEEIKHRQAEKAVDLTQLSMAHQKELARKKVNNMKLQNTVMQLRKVCSHPFLFNWPVDPTNLQPILNEELVSASGKMMVLDRLLTELFKRKHKVLLFSQFTTMLDIIEDWARELKGWNLCQQMFTFQNGGSTPNAPHLFLLSTRAGGLGINLVAADTVIFYDQDWNPQMDAQAQDRAHRIGQTRPVLIFRLVSAHTIETKIMQRATEKRQLEALVIAKGKFRMPTAAAQLSGKNESMAEMAASLLRLEGEKIDVVPNTTEGKANVLTDAELDALLDRSPEVFTDRGKGWTSADASGTVEGSKKAAFAVYEAAINEGNDALAMMLGEDEV
ncbi:SNF2 family N-terminal domain-containing protein [Rhodocollybia butyracea]|uniref:SNF2 family N-terminal domain-containing protein n=1 Tax=Rhodocollybia butyracea TaxID=206335 RepID=A0A9P5U4Z2_9AGAR|nr:SNF2 family N-terminal domain-containing protein [Rhodocollybia butyracea]